MLHKNKLIKLIKNYLNNGILIHIKIIENKLKINFINLIKLMMFYLIIILNIIMIKSHINNILIKMLIKPLKNFTNNMVFKTKINKNSSKPTTPTVNVLPTKSSVSPAILPNNKSTMPTVN
jgi:hypothetical protein